MADGIVNSGGGGSGGTLTVHAPAGATVTASKDGKTYTRRANAQGVAVFKGLKTGLWSVTISDGVQNPATQQVQVTADYEVTMAFFAAFIEVTYPEGSFCALLDDQFDVEAPLGYATDASGSYTFIVHQTGTYNVVCATDMDGTGDVDYKTVTITEDGQRVAANLAYQLYASDFEFYLGINKTTPAAVGADYEIVYDDDTAIDPHDYATAKNWKIRNLVTLYCVPLKNGKIDVFLVGGGASTGYSGTANYASAGGAGAGYTKTEKGVYVTAYSVYKIAIGSGGTYSNRQADSIGNPGGETSAFGFKAAGGKPGTNDKYPGTSSEKGCGGDGGSGGCGLWIDDYYDDTISQDGYDGGSTDGRIYGKGQRSNPGPNGETGSTREFGEADGKLYATGGIASGSSRAIAPEDNTGDGGSGGSNSVSNNNSSGASGIVVIRNARG